MKKNKLIIIGFIIMGLIVSGLIGYAYYKKNSNKKNNENNVSNKIDIKTDDSDTKVDWDSLDNKTIDDSYTIRLLLNKYTSTSGNIKDEIINNYKDLKKYTIIN